MILSVSRRTDIPQYYSDWFFNRMKEGFLYVKNPMNSHQVSRIELSPDLVDLVVFWTKNPEPMMKRIDELGEIPYYIQSVSYTHLDVYKRQVQKNGGNDQWKKGKPA